jgi:hypothetical protein
MAHRDYSPPAPRDGNSGRGKPLRDTHSLSPFRPAPGERTPPLVSPPIPRARRRQSGAGRVFSPDEVTVRDASGAGALRLSLTEG